MLNKNTIRIWTGNILYVLAVVSVASCVIISTYLLHEQYWRFMLSRHGVMLMNQDISRACIGSCKEKTVTGFSLTKDGLKCECAK